MGTIIFTSSQKGVLFQKMVKTNNLDVFSVLEAHKYQEQIKVELATLGRPTGHYFTVAQKMNTQKYWQKIAYQPRIIASKDLKGLGPLRPSLDRFSRTRVNLQVKINALKTRQDSGCHICPTTMACGLFSTDLFPQTHLFGEGRWQEQGEGVMARLQLCQCKLPEEKEQKPQCHKQWTKLKPEENSHLGSG